MSWFVEEHKKKIFWRKSSSVKAPLDIKKSAPKTDRKLLIKCAGYDSNEMVITVKWAFNNIYDQLSAANSSVLSPM